MSRSGGTASILLEARLTVVGCDDMDGEHVQGFMEEAVLERGLQGECK